MLRSLLGVAVYCSVLITTRTAIACSCAPPPKVSEAVKSAAAVFVGKAVEVRTGASPTESVVGFAVSNAIHGVEAKTSVLVFQESMCGYNFKKGLHYLVYAGYDDKGRFNASLCSRTKPAKNVVKELGQLRRLPKSSFGKAPRAIRPLSPGGQDCLEMYSECFDTENGQTCTSSPYHLPCGETGRVPRGDRIHCVCVP